MGKTNELSKTFNKRNFYTIKDSGVVYVLALLLPLLVGIVFAYFSMFGAMQSGVRFAEGTNIINQLFEDYFWFSIPYMLLTQIVFVCLWLCYHKAAKIDFRASSCSFKKANPWTAIISALVGIVCVLGFVWLIEGCFGSVFKAMGLKPSSLSLPLDNVGWLFVNLLILGVLPAICEELIFRGVIFHGLREKFSALSSVLLCGLLFALLHQNIMQFVYPFILGCLLSFVMEKTGNLLYPIIIHMFNNFTTIIITFLHNIGEINLVFNTSWWGWICAILIAAVVCAVLWVIYQFYLKDQEKIEVEKEGEVKQTESIMVGKFPMTLVCGMIVAVILIVINAVG